MSKRVYPHEPDFDDLRDIEQRREKRYGQLISEMPQNLEGRNERWMQLAAEDSIELASLAYGFEHPPSQVLKRFSAAAKHAEKALEFGLAISPYEFLQFVAIGLIAGEHPFVRMLSGFARTRFTDPEEKAPEAGYLLAEAEAALAAGNAEAARERIRRADASSAKMNRFEKAEFFDLIQMAYALLQKDQAMWEKAITARSKAFAKTYSHPDYQQFPEGLLDTRALGLAYFAKKAGLSINESVYVPISLLGK